LWQAQPNKPRIPLSLKPPQYRGRFAPSPTGPLHFGSLVTAVASYLQARQQQGQWLLRIDNIDPPREQAGAIEAILTALTAHGMQWHKLIYQHDRQDHYAAALERLSVTGHSFSCDCSRKKIQASRNPSAPTGAAIYPGFCRKRNLQGQQHAVRFRATGEVQLLDSIQGTLRQNLDTDVGDFIIKRRDGLFSYQLANVVDDEIDNISHVVRGVDLFENTPRQIALIHALGYRTPSYAHLPIAVNSQGQKLSKQTHAAALDNAAALHNLTAAWRFLGQTQQLKLTDTDSIDCKDCDSIEDFWALAVRNWDIRRVPREAPNSARYRE